MSTTSTTESSPGSVALHQQLWRVAQALQGIRDGRSGTAVLEQVPAHWRPGVQALLFQVLRSLGRAQALRALLATKTPAPAVDALLCTALALVWDSAQAPYTPFTLVNQAVEAARRHGLQRQAGFINACLRRFLRESAALVAQTDGDAQARYNHPRWWVDKLRQQYPEHWQAILEVNNRPAPMALRVNARQCRVADYLQQLQAQGIAAQPWGEHGVQLAQPLPVQRLPGFAQGMVSVQDGAAQLAAPLLLQGLSLPAQARILDACAAPGGKTAHLLEMLPLGQAKVYALEVDAIRSQRITETLQRLHLQEDAQVLVADAAQVDTWWPQVAQGMSAVADGGLDAVLLDAPCSASGIVRRHPDVRWLRRPSDIAQLARQQERLLQALWPLLKPGGRLLYCTCSVFKEEGQWQVEAFVARNKNAQYLPAPGHLLPGAASVPDNPSGDHDGFFYALLQKTKAPSSAAHACG